MDLLKLLLGLSFTAVFVDAGFHHCLHHCLNGQPTHCDCSIFGINSAEVKVDNALVKEELNGHHHQDQTAVINAFAATEEPVPTHASLISTTNICDYLCFIQLGGHACECSKPGVPG